MHIVQSAVLLLLLFLVVSLWNIQLKHKTFNWHHPIQCCKMKISKISDIFDRKCLLSRPSCVTMRIRYSHDDQSDVYNVTCESGLNTCNKPHLPSACVAQSAALRAATPVTGVWIPPHVQLFLFFLFFLINPLNSVFGLFSKAKTNPTNP